MNIWRKTLIAALWISTIAQAQAGVIIGGTRLIYDGGKKESSLNIGNPDKVPYLIQSWVEGPKGDTSKAPFVITPPIFRLDGGENNVLRVINTAGNMPRDRESLYWLNIKSIPTAAKQANTLQIAVKTSLKLIYRPRGLEDNVTEAGSKLKWQRNGSALLVTNPSPFYVTLFAMKMNGVAVKEAAMVAPNSSETINLSSSAGGTFSWQIINDFGGTSNVFNATL